MHSLLVLHSDNSLPEKGQFLGRIFKIAPRNYSECSSLARGDAVPGSDADLLIVVRHSTEPFLDRAVRYRPAGVGVGVDVVAYTREELTALLEAGNAFVRQALCDGMVLVSAHLGDGGYGSGDPF